MNKTYNVTFKKKSLKIERLEKKRIYETFFRKDERFKNFTEFYNCVKGKDYDELLFGKPKEYTKEELEIRKKEVREKYILREEKIEREDFNFYVWIFKTKKRTTKYIKENKEFKERTKTVYNTSIIVELIEEVDNGYIFNTINNLFKKISYSENKALKDYDILLSYIKNNSTEKILNDIFKEMDDAILYYKEKRYKNRDYKY